MSENKNVFQKGYEWANEKVRDRDLFGIPISLTYNGDTEFKTGIGGWISMLVTFILLYYTAILLKVVIQRDNSTVTVNTIQTDLTYDPTEYNIGQNGFTFGVALVHNNGSDMVLDPTIVEMDIEQVTWMGAEIGDGHSMYSTPLTYGLCDPTDFENLNEETLGHLNVWTEYYCPDTHDYKISGNLISTYYNYVRIKIKKCSSGSCLTESAIDDALQGVELKLAVANSYFDVDDYDEPIQYYYDDELRWKIMPGFKMSKYVQIQRNTADVLDDPMPWGTSDSYEFFSIERILDKIELEDSGSTDEVFEIRLRLASSHQEYERKVYTAGDMFSQIGGIFEILLLAGGYVVGMFSTNMYTSSLLSSLYQVEHKPTNFEIVTNKVNPSFVEEHDIRFSPRNNEFSPRVNSFHPKTANTEGNMVQNVPNIWKNDAYQNDIVLKAQKSVLKRKPFKNSCADLAYAILCCPKYRCRQPKPGTYDYRYRLLKKGSDKVDDEFDVVSFIKYRRKLHDTNKIKFSSTQNLLLNQSPAMLTLEDENINEGDGGPNTCPECISQDDNDPDTTKEKVIHALQNIQERGLTQTDIRILQLLTGKCMHTPTNKADSSYPMSIPEEAKHNV